MIDIAAAYEGYRDELEAIHGKPDEPDEEMMPASDEGIKNMFRSLKTMH